MGLPSGRARCASGWVGALLLAPMVGLGAGCATSGGGDTLALYRARLARTDTTRLGGAPGERATARAALDRFLAALQEYSPEAMSERVGGLYAVDAYFNDQVKELVGVAAIREYLVRSAEMLVEPRIDVQDVADHDGDFYVRWIITFRTRKKPDAPPTVARGITHVRFDREGKVAFHEDFWDVSTAIYERVPLLGSLVRRVKASL